MLKKILVQKCRSLENKREISVINEKLLMFDICNVDFKNAWKIVYI